MAAHLLTMVHEYAYFKTNSNNKKIKIKLKNQLNANN